MIVALRSVLRHARRFLGLAQHVDDSAWAAGVIEGKGIGIRACEAIPFGACIWAETLFFECDNPCPDLVVDKPPFPDARALRDKRFPFFTELEATLTDAMRASLWELSDCNSGPKTLAGIVGTNAFGNDKSFCVFKEASRFNHSCCPNMDHHWSAGHYRFTAARDIAAGEELCISYLRIGQLLQSQDERQQDLSRTYNFKCRCDACEGKLMDIALSNQLRERIRAFCQMSTHEWLARSAYSAGMFERFLVDLRKEQVSLRSVVDPMDSPAREFLLSQIGEDKPEVAAYRLVANGGQLQPQLLLENWTKLLQWSLLAAFVIAQYFRQES